MKKIILLVVLTTLGMSLNSCSSDDSGEKTQSLPLNPVGTISFKVNGATKTFNTFIMKEDGQFLDITATIDSSIADIIKIKIDKDELGTNVIYDFRYIKNTVNYYRDGNFVSLITTNSNRQIIGSFNGQISDFGTDLTITNGSINISY